MKNLPLYLDYMATTPVDPQVADVMMQCLTAEGNFGNPSSTTHEYGRRALHAVETARISCAQVLGASPEEIIFTSGATESDNLAILGAARFYQTKGRHLITLTTEHPAVLDSMQQLEKEGFEVTYLDPKPDGLLDLNCLSQALRADTLLVSVMHVNNEIGVIQDIAEIGELLRKRGILFHVDAAQSAGKLPINLSELNVSLMSFSAHKMYGPKGVGALYIRQRPRVRLQPLTFGGGQQRAIRSGTLPTHQIVAMGAAMRLSEQVRVSEQARLLSYRQKIWNAIQTLPGIVLNGSHDQRIAGNLNLTFSGIDGESLLFALNDLALSSTSACASAKGHPSHVLKALGLDDNAAYSTLRLSLGRFTKEEDVDTIIRLLQEHVGRLQAIAGISA